MHANKTPEAAKSRMVEAEASHAPMYDDVRAGR
jgi:hypothetical protein